MNRSDIKGHHVKVVYDDGRWLKGRIEAGGRITPDGMAKTIPCLSWDGDDWVPANGIMDIYEIWNEWDWVPIAWTDAESGDAVLVGSGIYTITKVPEHHGPWVVESRNDDDKGISYILDLPMISEFLRPVTKGKENG